LCGPDFCSMRIIEDVRKYAAERGMTDAEAIESGMQEKRKEFLEKGAEIYAKTQSCSRLVLSRRYPVVAACLLANALGGSSALDTLRLARNWSYSTVSSLENSIEKTCKLRTRNAAAQLSR
jgi:hypothetical protein